MPDVASAIPDHLDRLAAVIAERAERVARAAASVDAALGSLRASGSVGVSPAIGLDLVPALVAHATAGLVAADGVADVARAFARAGAGVDLPAGLDAVVRAGDAELAALLSLPGGRAPTIDELQALSFAEVASWFAEVRRLPGFEDPDFRAVEGLLGAAAVTPATGGLFLDSAFDRADAAVLTSMLDGWLASRGVDVATPPGLGDDAVAARRDAVEGWRRWFDHDRLLGDEGRRDRAWAASEERSVRAAEALLEDEGSGFTTAVAGLVRFTHAYRHAVANGREAQFVGAALAAIEPSALQRLKDDIGDVVSRRIAAAAREAEAIARERTASARSLLDLAFPVGGAIAEGAVRSIEEIGTVAGEVIDTAIDVVPVRYAGLELGTIPDMLGATEDLSPLLTLLVDPSATPPVAVRSFLDELLGQRPPMADPPGSYYVAALYDRGYLNGLERIDAPPAAIPDVPIDD